MNTAARRDVLAAAALFGDSAASMDKAPVCRRPHGAIIQTCLPE
jgi:hypothetical protein